MPTLTIQVLKSSGSPAVYEKVFLTVEKGIMPDTWLEDRTDNDGEAVFDLPENCVIDVSIRGNVEESGIRVGQSSKGITIHL